MQQAIACIPEFNMSACTSARCGAQGMGSMHLLQSLVSRNTWPPQKHTSCDNQGPAQAHEHRGHAAEEVGAGAAAQAGLQACDLHPGLVRAGGRRGGAYHVGQVAGRPRAPACPAPEHSGGAVVVAYARLIRCDLLPCLPGGRAPQSPCMTWACQTKHGLTACLPAGPAMPSTFVALQGSAEPLPAVHRSNQSMHTLAHPAKATSSRLQTLHPGLMRISKQRVAMPTFT